MRKTSRSQQLRSLRELQRAVWGDEFLPVRRPRSRRHAFAARGSIVALSGVLLASASGLYLQAGAAPGGIKGKPRPTSATTTTTKPPATTTTTAAPATTTTTNTTVAPATTTTTRAATTTTTAPQSTGSRSLFWGAWIGSQLTGTQAPWDMNAVSSFANLAGKQPSLVNWSSPFYSANNCNGYCQFVASNFDRVRNNGQIPFFSWNSGPGTGAFTNAQIAAGAQDSYLTAWATAAKNWGHPLFLRFNWEMNGAWFPWGVGNNGNTATDYVAMWRHVHDRFVAAGATNVSWVWCPNIDQYNRFAPLSQVYPGDSYVDWTCLDGYNWGTNPNGNLGGWQSFDQVYHSTYHAIVDTVAPTKPMIIGEVGSTEYGGSKAAWITDMLTVQLPQNYPKVSGVLWFEKGGAEADGMDWPIESSSTSPTAFKNGIAGTPYKSNVYSGLGGTVIAAP